MISIKNGKVFTTILVLIAASAINAATLRVSALDGPYKTITAAIKDAKPGDIVMITDNEVYKEQVTIDSTKNGLTLTAETPLILKSRPTVQWQDVAAQNPKTCALAQDEAASTGYEKAGTYFDQCGALRVLRARGVIIDGIIIDGGGAAPFVNKGVWSGPGCAGQSYDLFHGNAALDLWISGDITVRNCDIQNGYFGINVKDRNVRGIFASPNPSDISRQNIVPLSGFGKTGNHIFENNRIHNNSWGMFFESAWDLGSVIRYNLFFENHHASGAIATQVKGMGSEGPKNQGGAILFKDVALSPIAIYNNTFWHNAINLAGQWQAGASHVVFNNIFAQPLALWQTTWKTNPVTSPFDEPSIYSMETVYAKQLKHNTFAANLQMDSANVYIGFQVTDPDTKQPVQSIPQHMPVKIPVINNDLRAMESGGSFTVKIPYSADTIDTVIYTNNNQVFFPGAKILGPNNDKFPADANNRWLEPKFKSTDPQSADFLVPDWDDTVMKAIIVDKGWPDAGVRDADGTIADLGAKPFNQQAFKDEIVIKPTKPVVINNGTATVSFNLYALTGSMSNPVIKYVRWMQDLPRDTTAWGKQANSGNVLNVNRPGVLATPTLTTTTVNIGLNTISFPVTQAGEYAYLELIVEGKGSSGETVTSAVGFLPYRKLQSLFTVKLYPPDGPMTTELTSVQVGEPYRLQIVPVDVKGSPITFGEIKETQLSMVSPYDLLDPDGKKIVITGVPIPGGYTTPVMFTKIPESGWDIITANGIYYPVASEAGRAIMGTSAQINIKPGLPAKILFDAPPSKGLDMIYPGIPYDVRLQVYDKYDNKVKVKTAVNLESKAPNKGNIGGKPTAMVDTDTNGVANFKMDVGDEWKQFDTIPIIGKLVSVAGAEDNAKLIIGKPKNKYYIFFGDTAMYDPKVIIPENTCTGTRVPVQIRASTNGLDTLTDIINEFAIEFNPTQIVAYATDSDNDTVKISTAKLKKGVAKIYIQALVAGSIRDGMVTVSDVPGNTTKLQANSRKGINFTSCITSIKNASYTANNGNGVVDQLDIYYIKALKETEIPDSVEIYWPTKADTRKMVKKANMKLDPKDSAHVIVTLPDPFPAGITASAKQDLGISYWRNPTLTETVTANFNISDKVGPIIKGAWLIERLTAGKSDTLIVAFSEFVQTDKVTGEALQLTTRGGIVLNVLSATPMTDNRLKIAIENKGEDRAPKDGDSIKIYVDASGVSKVVDANGIVAHKDNRPVELVIQEIAPSIDTAGYYDVNGDGTVDQMTLKFNKKVKIGDQKYLAFFGSSIKTDTIYSASASYINNDSTRVALDLTGKFKGNADLKTSGDMTVTVESKRFSDIIKKKADDHAAPVIIDTVWYYQGKIFKDGTKADDTLYVAFSEQLSSQPASLVNAFKFSAKSGGEFTLSLVNARQTTMKNQITYEFLVKSVSGVKGVSSGDRATIKVDGKTSVVVDALNNAQSIDPNRKAIIWVKEQPVELNIRIGPSPFIAGGSDALTISVQPQASEDQGVNTSVKINIFDYLGNCVYIMSDELKSKDLKTFKWNGRNQKGRVVGMGTYLIVIKSKDNNKQIQTEEAHKIAVKSK
jgi:hypothetical protein